MQIILLTNESIHGWGTKKGKKHLKTFESYFLQYLHKISLSEKNWIVQYKIIYLLMVIFYNHT
jgi:hypothetical protein